MKKVNLFILLIVLLIQVISLKAKVIDFIDLVNPNSIQIRNKRIYITDRSSIYIYSLNDFKLIKKFGTEGSGPKEFRLLKHVHNGGVNLSINSKFIVINSIGKISFYTLSGEYIKEIPTHRSSGKYFKVGNNYIGTKSVQDKKGVEYYTYNLYDSKLKKINEIYRTISWDESKKLDPISFTKWPIFYSYKNKIYIDRRNDTGDIQVFNSKGEASDSIVHKYKKTEVEKSHITKYKKFFNSSISGYKRFFEEYKHIVKFSEYFPVIRDFHFSDNKIYVVTYGMNEETYETFVFNLDGKFAGKVFLKLKEKDPIHLYPYTTYQNRLFQLVENIDEEGWELHITMIE